MFSKQCEELGMNVEANSLHVTEDSNQAKSKKQLHNHNSIHLANEAMTYRLLHLSERTRPEVSTKTKSGNLKKERKKK